MAVREIMIDTIYGKKPERATVYGAFGIHPAQWSNGDKSFVVTHIPTGRAITFDAPSVQAGLRLARMLTRGGVRWSFTDIKKAPKRTMTIGKAIYQRWNQQRRGLRGDPVLRDGQIDGTRDKGSNL